VEPLLVFADELERRDAAAARAIDDVERLQREVEELRTHAAATAAFLAALPAQRDVHAKVERSALDAHARAETALREAAGAVDRARRDDDRLAAERALQLRRDDLRAAERWIDDARAARERLEREADRRIEESQHLEARAAELAPRIRDVRLPGRGLEDVLEWASVARGALLVEHSGLARERDAVVREASELLGSVLGEPLAATSAAGLRGRLERALGQASA
jgi:FtsZ-binding cell division protein ZapB